MARIAQFTGTCWASAAAVAMFPDTLAVLVLAALSMLSSIEGAVRGLSPDE